MVVHEARSYPVTVAVKVAYPTPDALNVHVNVCVHPGGRYDVPDGTAPTTRVTSPKPGPTTTDGIKLAMTKSPVFVTVSVTVIHRPTC
jgi:hypothetical protein